MRPLLFFIRLSPHGGAHEEGGCLLLVVVDATTVFVVGLSPHAGAPEEDACLLFCF